QQSAIKDSFSYQVFNRLLRGINLPLPDGVTVQGSDGLLRRTFRAKFWPEAQTAKTYADFAFQPDPIPEQVALKPLPKELLQQVEQHSNEQPILFVGHYWCKGEPSYIQPNLACLDYSAVNSGKLVAYRLDQETQLDANKFVWVKGGL
ncbi:MAG: serine/threonine protein phosphatase, partial [Thiopseudomonas sp.]|nr:serine/threonine protein phosphatase [Thiopseudomonas sp.]